MHQACDILFCKANVVPIGKDNLPHVEITRTIARRFNERYAKKNPVFPEPAAILSEAPEIPGLDGRKMSKSYGNSIMLGATAEETAKLIKKSPTDSERRITFDPVARPQVSALLTTAGLVTGRDPKDIAEEIGDSGAARSRHTSSNQSTSSWPRTASAAPSWPRTWIPFVTSCTTATSAPTPSPRRPSTRCARPWA